MTKTRVWYAKNKKKRVYKYREGAHTKIRYHNRRVYSVGQYGGKRVGKK